MEYPKIHSLFKREDWYFKEDVKAKPQVGRQSLIEGDYALPEFGNVQKWLVQEKIDGTNVRIFFEGLFNETEERLSNEIKSDLAISIYGRTNNADVPKPLIDHIKSIFTWEKLIEIFPPQKVRRVLFFGEGYGARIQKGGGNYRKDMGFILFDVQIGDTWLKQEDVKDIAEKLGIPYAPIIGIMTEEEIVAYVKSKPLSLCSEDPQVLEGIVARSEPLMLLRNGDPLMFKLKCKEF
jgi:hypothetical protein